jgi:tRNA uridine 5-carboxymethylaminomethyl modification enzyme
MIHIGNVSYPAGRHRRNSEEVEPPSIGLSKTIEDTLGFRLGRYKTGTPPRLLRKTIDFSCLPVQKSQDQLWFSFSNEFNRVPYPNPFLDSYITQTNERSHSIV